MKTSQFLTFILFYVASFSEDTSFNHLLWSVFQLSVLSRLIVQCLIEFRSIYADFQINCNFGSFWNHLIEKVKKVKNYFPDQSKVYKLSWPDLT